MKNGKKELEAFRKWAEKRKRSKKTKKEFTTAGEWVDLKIEELKKKKKDNQDKQ